MTRPRIWFLTPSYHPVGGVVKVFDYVLHALDRGHECIVTSPKPLDRDSALFRNRRYRRLVSDEFGVEFQHTDAPAMRRGELAFFSWPTHFRALSARAAPGVTSDAIIHLVQNVRHANPRWTDGYALRLLSRPMTRIMTNEVVLDACRPYLNQGSRTVVIDLGHDTAHFAKDRKGALPERLTVGYTTWKSEVGDAIAAALAGDDRVEFRAVRGYVDWDELRDFYRSIDVFLATPYAEEGFYMPGLEAMAAGAVVVSPDAGGNRSYMRFGDNAVFAELDNVDSYVAALRAVTTLSGNRLAAMRASAREAVGRHTLAGEARGFGALLDELVDQSAAGADERIAVASASTSAGE